MNVNDPQYYENLEQDDKILYLEIISTNSPEFYLATYQCIFKRWILTVLA